MQKFGLLAVQVSLAKLLSRQQYCIQRGLDLMSDRSVQDLINVAQKSVLVYFNLLSCLLNDYNFGVSLSEPANFSLDLEEAVLFTKFKSVAHVWLFDQCFERHSTIVLITAFLKSKVLVFVQG